ncbi:MAG: PilN domain-containing protein [Candidatus Nanopelagicales bacterium]
MIEIDLLPGTQAKPRSTRRRLDLTALVRGIGGRFNDPWLAIAVISVLLGGGIAGGMWNTQRQAEARLREEETRAVQDSVRFHAVLTRLRLAEAQRDSVLAQMGTIAAIDRRRFIWPHLLDEIARALPMYTWLRSVAQSSAATTASADQVAKDSLPPLALRVIGVTIDIQALTIFMKQLEASPFISDVSLATSSVTQVEGKEVNEFTIDLRYERPDTAILRTVPLTLAGGER